MISCFKLKPCIKCYFKLVLKGFKLKKLVVEPKKGSTGRPVVLVRSSTDRGPVEAQRSPAKHLMLTASQPVDP